jgi:hypothetical protein
MTSAKLKAIVFDRDGNRCVIAGPNCTGVAVDPDHRANRGSGGSKVLDIPENIISACRLCNGMKEDVDRERRADLIARGLRVEKAATNAVTVERCRLRPVMYPDGWFFLEGNSRREVAGDVAVALMIAHGAIRVEDRHMYLQDERRT